MVRKIKRVHQQRPIRKDRELILQTIDGLQQNIQQQQSMLDALIAFLENIEGSAENDQIQGVIGQLKAVKNHLANLSQLLDGAKKLFKIVMSMD